MKRKRYFLGVLFFAAALASCEKAPADLPGPEGSIVEEKSGTFSIVASTDKAVTRTELDGSHYITWKSGDDLSVWEKDNASNSNVKLDIVPASVGQRQGTFSGSLTPASSSFKLYAVYPYSSTYEADPSAVTVSLPSAVEQKTSVNQVVGVSDFMVGAGSFTDSDSEYLMRFRYPLTLLDIVIDGSTSCLSGATIESLTITATKAFTGEATLNLTDGTLVPADVAAGKSLTITFPSSAKMNAENHAWVAVYPADLTAASCCFDLKMTNGQEIKFNVNPKKAFEEQKIYSINLTNIDAHVDAGEATPIYFDLVGANTSKGYSLNRANCYIISEGGYYKFAAQKVDKSNVFEGSNPYTSGYRAKWLWATSNESKADFISLGNSGSVNFRAPAGANGSTIIAVLDPSSNIVWSWHIWCTGDDTIMEPYHYGRNNAWLASDINLGATGKSGTGAYGFYYQWGRKDPFPGVPGDCVYNEGISISGLSSKNGAVTPDAIGYAIAHPTTLLYANDYQTWISTASQATAAQDLWTKTARNKSNYDPCPAGYAVPWQNDYAWYTNFTAANMSFGTTGFTFTYDAHSTYYPAAGYLNGLTLTDAGKTVRCWAANINGTPSATTNMQARSLLVDVSTNTVTINASSRTAFGMSVRCMKI